MYSILHKIDNNIKNKELDIKSFKFSSSYFPKYLNKAILFEVHDLDDAFFDAYSKEVTFGYDLKGGPYFIVTDLRKRHNILIIADNYKTDVPFRTDRVIIESNLIRNMYLMKYTENYMINKKHDFAIQYPHLSHQQRNIMEYRLLKIIIKNANEKLVNSKKDITTMYDYTSDLHRTTMNILKYATYLDNYYKKYVKTK